MPRTGRKPVHLVTQARTPKSEDIGYRQRRYLIMMGIRVACFLVAIVMVTQGAGWFAAIPAVGAIVIPYFAVVFANGGREPTDTRGFREYRPSLPERQPASGGPSGDTSRRVYLRDTSAGGARPGEAEPPAAAPGDAAPGEAAPGDGAAGDAGNAAPGDAAHPGTARGR